MYLYIGTYAPMYVSLKRGVGATPAGRTRDLCCTCAPYSQLITACPYVLTGASAGPL